MTDLISREAALDLLSKGGLHTINDRLDAIAALPAVTPATVGVPTDCRRWPYYPIQMPFTKDGKGPATIGVDAESISYEVWDCVYNSYASFDNLPDAINEAMRLSIAALTPPPVDASQTPDPVLSDPRVKALVEAAYAEGFSEGADGGWIEGDYSKPWSKSAALRAIGGEA